MRKLMMVLAATLVGVSSASVITGGIREARAANSTRIVDCTHGTCEFGGGDDLCAACCVVSNPMYVGGFCTFNEICFCVEG